MHTKKIYYVSHPFTGDEEKNRQEAREITAKLKKAYPQFIFINPLDVFQYAELVEEWKYNDILNQCLELLQNCDGIFMTGYWLDSQGCLTEKGEALRLKLDIYNLWKRPGTDEAVLYRVEEDFKGKLRSYTVDILKGF